jgi:hypothetical protein
VDDGHVGPVRDFLTGALYSNTKINFFAIEEEGRIKEAGTDQCSGTNNAEGAGNPIDLCRLAVVGPGSVGASKEPRLRKARGQACDYNYLADKARKRPAGRLQSTVAPSEPASCESAIGILIHVPDGNSEGARLEKRVGVEQNEVAPQACWRARLLAAPKPRFVPARRSRT